MWPRTKEAYASYEENVKVFFQENRIIAITTDNESYISSNGCDCCNSWEQQELFEAPAIVRNLDGNKEYTKNFEVCTDCQYYLEYGRLEDTQMDEIDASSV